MYHVPYVVKAAAFCWLVILCNLVCTFQFDPHSRFDLCEGSARERVLLGMLYSSFDLCETETVFYFVMLYSRFDLCEREREFLI